MNFKNYFLGLLMVSLTLPTLCGAQARRIPMFEHFTQASCGPCASQNPSFTALYNANNGNAHHVAIHTAWPGTDPMYTANMPESAAMVAVYGISAVPNMVLNGTNIGSPASARQTMINDAGISPVEVIVTKTNLSGSSKMINVAVKNYELLPAGNYIVRTMLVEKLKTYATAPGSNGEKTFPNVFRATIGGTAGRAYVPSMANTVVNYTDSIALNAAWVDSQMYVIAYVQNVATKEILNSGSNLDPNHSFFDASPISFLTGANNFNATVRNTSAAPVTLALNMVATAPAGWVANYTVNANTYTGAATVSIPANTSYTMTINATPNATAGVGYYKLTATDNNNPGFAAQTVEYNTIVGVTDLLVHNNTDFGVAGNFNWQPMFEAAAATTANAATFGSVTNSRYVKGLESGALNNIHSIYRNCGWTFPAITDEEVAQLIPYLNAGGNLFIGGQDVGWSVADAGSAGATPAQLAFYNDYMKADYISDGTTALNQLKADLTDGYFKTLATSPISAVYGATNFFPDLIAPLPGGVSIAQYGNGSTAAMRTDTTSNYKVVYVVPGLEMLNLATRNQFFKTTHDWFHGLISPVKLDETLANMLGNIYPNPAQNSVVLNLDKLTQNATLRIQDVLGKTVLTQNINAGTQTINLDLSNLASGTYQYQLMAGSQVSGIKKLVVLK